MKPKHSSPAGTFFAASFFVFCAASPDIGNGRDRTGAIKLNESTLEHASKLIAQGHFVADNRGAWSQHRPSAEEENRFIRLHGFDEYGKWFLGIDERHARNSKARYKFPCGDFKNIHRCALLAAENRAGQFHHSDIEEAAIHLRKLIEAQSDPHPGE
jgi:hypothetical protein